MRPEPGRQFYAEDLAYVHDAGFLGFAERAAPGVLQRLGRTCPPGARVVEIGCGSGGLTGPLTRAGYRVLAVDVSPAMIRLARRRAPRATCRVASTADLKLPRCGAVVAVGECLNYLRGGPRRHEKALRRFFRRVARALPPGGLLLFDFLEPAARRPRRRQVEASGPDWTVLVAVREDPARRLVTRWITTIREVDGRQRLSVEVHRQRLLPRRELMDWLQAAGFAVRFRAGYGRRRLRPGHTVVEATRLAGLSRRPPARSPRRLVNE
jgi:SAM-dependent methyltransferase